MRGVIKKKNDKWSIEYWDKLLPPNEIRSILKELPLHPDTNPFGFSYNSGDEVEFEIVGDIKDLSNNGKLIQYAKLISIQKELPESKVTRLEVIDHSGSGVGRAYSKHGINSLELSYQDDGKTLKIFIK